MIRSVLGLVTAAAFLAACAPLPPGAPALAQPSLVSVGLRGPQICGQGLWDAESNEVCSAAAYLARRQNEKPTCDVWQVPTVEACIFP